MSDELNEFVTHIRNASATASGQRPPTEAAATPQQEWAKTLAAASCWAQSGNSYFPVSDVVPKLLPGAYRCMTSNTGPYFEKMKIQIDDLLALPDSATEKLLAEFSQFWTLEPAFAKRGFTFKRGMLMWGPPGSGKTSAVWQMTQRLVADHKGIVVFIDNPQVAVWCLTVLRRIEPDRPLITVMEDIDAIIANHGEHSLLALLDGEFQISNVVHVATTNYPGLLDRRFVDRPSRFDTIMKVGMPSGEARKMYFMVKEPDLHHDVVARWVDRTEGYSIAHLREVCIATQCFKQDESDVFERLDKMREIIQIDETGEDRSPAGFLQDSLAKHRAMAGAGRKQR